MKRYFNLNAYKDDCIKCKMTPYAYGEECDGMEVKFNENSTIGKIDGKPYSFFREWTIEK